MTSCTSRAPASRTGTHSWPRSGRPSSSSRCRSSRSSPFARWRRSRHPRGEPMAQYELNLRDYWRILRKRKWIVVFVALAFGGMAYVFAEVQKPNPIYQATAVVKFERSTTLVGLLVETISLSTGDNLATQSAVIRSFPVLERAAKASRMIPPDMDSEAIKRNPRSIQVISDLRGQITAAPEENTTLINITVTSPDSTQAARIANAVAQAYREENLLTRSQKIRDARRFIEEQLAEATGRL